MNRFNENPDWDDVENRTNKAFGWLVFVAILMFIISLFIPQNCSAQDVCDTIPLPTKSLVDVVQKTSKSGKPVFYAVFLYDGVEDVTTMSKSTVDYIQVCKECKIQPKLALRIKNGEVVSIIRQKRGSKYEKR